MADSRTHAHEAFRALWEVADRRLREDGVLSYCGHTALLAVDTQAGATLTENGGVVYISAEFADPAGIIKTVTVTLPEDIRDLSESEVLVSWCSEYGAGAETLPIEEFPEIACELQALI